MTKQLVSTQSWRLRRKTHPNNIVSNDVANADFPNGNCRSGSKEDRKKTSSGGLDTRFVSFVSIDQYSLFSANGVAGNGLEDKADVMALADKGHNIYNNYAAVAMDKEGKEGDPTSIDATTSVWELSGRTGIEWTTSCDDNPKTSRANLIDYLDEVKEMGAQQENLANFQWVFGLLIVGILIPVSTYVWSPCGA